MYMYNPGGGAAMIWMDGLAIKPARTARVAVVVFARRAATTTDWLQ